MAFKREGLDPTASGSTGLASAVYRTTDTMATVEAPGYFKSHWALFKGIAIMGVIAADEATFFKLVVTFENVTLVRMVSSAADGEKANVSFNRRYETEAAFLAANVPAAVISLETMGYSSSGDGGGHLKRRIDTPDPVQPWHKRSADGAWWETAEDVAAAEMFGDVSTPVAFTVALQIACDYVAIKFGGGTVQLRPKTYTMAPHPLRTVGTNEGTGVLFTSTHKRVAVVGHKERTRIKPVSNKVELFLQNGGEDIYLEGIIFDNGDNGLLNNQVKPGSYTLMGGVAGYGNNANCALRQVSGGGLKVRNCGFIGFTCAIDYIGEISNVSQLSGIYDVQDCWWQGCIQCNLVSQPQSLFLMRSRCIDNRDSVNFDTSLDPGHLLYLSNRAGAYPDHVIVDGWTSSGGYSSSIKVRKGKNVSISNGTILGDGRGVELHNCDGGVVSNVTVTLAATTTDPARNGLELDDCGNVSVANYQIDIQGVDAWGVRIRADTGINPWQNRGARISGVEVVVDYSASGGKAPCVITDQTQLDIDLKVTHYGTVVPMRHPIHCGNVTNSRFAVLHFCPDGAADAHRLVQFDAGCTGNYVRARNAEMSAAFVFGSDALASVYDLGSSNKVDLEDFVSGNFTPTISFATPNTFTTTYAIQVGAYRRYKDRVRFWMRVQFTPTKGVTPPTGNMLIGGLPVAAVAASSLANFPCELSEADNITYESSSLQIVPTVINGQNYMQIFGLRTNAANVVLGPGALAGTDGATAYNLVIAGEYLTSF